MAAPQPGYMEVTGPDGTVQRRRMPSYRPTMASAVPPRTTSSARRPTAGTPGGVPGQAGVGGNISATPDDMAGVAQPNAQQAVAGRQQNYAQTMGAAYGPRTTPQPGAPVNGMVGSPNLGTVSELQRWARQVPGGEQYLRSIGMMPEVTTMRVGSLGTSGGGANGIDMMNNAALTSGNSATDEAASARYAQANGLLGGQDPRYPASGAGSPAAGTRGFQPMGGPRAQTRPPSGLSGRLEGAITGMLDNPTGYTDTQQQQLRNRAVDPISQQMMEGMEDVRADAARRGAATSDADVRDQLGRVRADSAMSASETSFNVDKALADLSRQTRLGAVGAGNQLLGTQLQDARSQQELELLLAQLQAEQQMDMGPMAGLSSVFGG